MAERLGGWETYVTRTLSRSHFEVSRLTTSKPTFVPAAEYHALLEVLPVSSFGPKYGHIGSSLLEQKEFSSWLSAYQVSFFKKKYLLIGR